MALGPFHPIYSDECGPKKFQLLMNLTDSVIHTQYCHEIFCDSTKFGILQNQTISAKRSAFVVLLKNFFKPKVLSYVH
jgi:hypothetical protein